MRVLFPYVGDTFGGSHRSSLLLVEGLNELPGVEAVPALHNNNGILGSYLVENQIQYELLPSVKLVGSEFLGRQILKMLLAAVPLATYLKQRSIEIVHVNDRRMHLTWLLAAKLAGASLVWHQRSPSVSRRITGYARLADAVVTISDYCKSSFPPSMKGRAQVVRNPIGARDVSYDYPTSRALVTSELGLDPHSFVVSWVANWIGRKRPMDFIALADVICRRTDRKVVFLMFGEPREPIATDVRHRIQGAGLEKCVYVMGIRRPIEPYIQGSDLLVSTAESEGHGRTLIEAMFLRTPVVATADGGHLEIIEDGIDGWLVPVGDIDAMANAAMEVMQASSEVEQRVDAAEQKIKQKFTLGAHVRSIMRIYERCQF